MHFALVVWLVALACGSDSARVFYNEWLPANGVKASKEVELRDLPRRGLYVRRSALSNGTFLLAVPRKAMLLPELAASAIGSVQANPTELSALALLYAKHGDAETRRKWRGYVDALPQELTTPLWLWTEANELLRGSHVLNNTRDRKRHVDSRYTVLRSVLPPWFAENVSLRGWTWALSIVWSRLFVVQLDGNEGRALAPLADMCNSPSAENETSNVRVEMEDNTISYFAARDLAAGEELLVDYGRQPKQNTQLVLDYGFRRSFISPTLDYAIVRLKLEREQLKAHNLWQDHGYLIMPNTFPHQLMKALRLQLATAEEASDEGTVQRMAKHSQPLSLANEHLALATLLSLLEGRVAEYDTSLEFDRARLNRTDLSPFETMARWQLVAEKSALTQAAKVTRVLLQRLDRDTSEL
jgi:hypothetical protein